MSACKRMKIACPKCSKKFNTIVYEALNTDYDRDIILKQVVNGSCFRKKCPHCGFVVHLEYDLLYHDMKHGEMIWVIHNNNEEAYAKKVDEINRVTQLLPFIVTRIVPDMNTLSEKVACLQSERDDRVVELLKVYLISSFNQLTPELDITKAVYTYQNGRSIVNIYCTNGQNFICDIGDSVYNMILDLFKKPLSEMKTAPFYVINYEWAYDFFYSQLSDEVIEKLAAENKQLRDEVIEKIAVENGQSADIAADVDTPDPVDTFEAFPVKKALFCRKCGAKLSSDGLFCNYCGTKVVY